jgi:hypothetical protein
LTTLKQEVEEVLDQLDWWMCSNSFFAELEQFSLTFWDPPAAEKSA